MMMPSEFQKSNKWDAARDVLLLESRQLALQSHERENRKYTKQKNDYWDDGIVETRKKRQRSQAITKMFFWGFKYEICNSYLCSCTCSSVLKATLNRNVLKEKDNLFLRIERSRTQTTLLILPLQEKYKTKSMI